MRHALMADTTCPYHQAYRSLLPGGPLEDVEAAARFRDKAREAFPHRLNTWAI